MARDRDASPQFRNKPGFQGMYTDLIQPFVYFYHYTGYFPISWVDDVDALVERESAARTIVCLKHAATGRPDHSSANCVAEAARLPQPCACFAGC